MTEEEIEEIKWIIADIDCFLDDLDPKKVDLGTYSLLVEIHSKIKLFEARRRAKRNNQ